MKLYHFVSILLTSCFASQAFGQVAAPRVGAVRYSDGSVWGLFGVSRNFVLNGQLAASTDAASFSDSGGLISIQGRIRLVGPKGALVDEYDSGEAHPVLSVTGDLTTAIAWLPTRNQFVRWNGRALVVTEPDTAALRGNVGSIDAVDAHHARAFIQATDQTVSVALISTDTGAILSNHALSYAHGPAIQQQSFVICVNDGQLEERTATRILHSLPFNHSGIAFERAGSDWIHITTSDSNDSWMLHITGSAFDLSQIPSTPQLSAGAAK